MVVSCSFTFGEANYNSLPCRSKTNHERSTGLSYVGVIEQVNARGDGSIGFITQKHEIESYLHSDVIKAAFDVDVVVTDHPNEDGKATPKVFAEVYSAAQGYDGVMKDNNAKIRLAERAFPSSLG